MTKEEMYAVYEKVRKERLLEDAKLYVDEYIQSLKDELDYDEIVDEFILRDDGYMASYYMWRQIIEDHIKDLFR